MRDNQSTRVTFFSLVLGSILISCSDHANEINRNNRTELKPLDSPYYITFDKAQGNEQSNLLSSIGKELEYIVLETNPNSIIGENPNFVFTSDFIFVADAPYGKLLQFDITGKFIRQIGLNGRGPGEYSSASNFCIDQRNKKIYIMSCWSNCKILEFNFDGEFNRSIEVPWESNRFLVFDTLGLAFEIADYSPTSSGVIPQTSYSFLQNNIIVTDFNCKPLFMIKRHFFRDSNLSGSGAAFYLNNNGLRFQQFGVDTLYNLIDKKLEPLAIFNLGENKMDPNIKFMGSNADIKDKIEQIKDDIFIKRISENPDYLFITLNIGLSDSSNLFSFNKNTKKLANLKSNKFENDIDGGLSFYPRITVNDSIIGDYATALDVKNKKLSKRLLNLTTERINLHEQFKDLANNLTETSNPVIILLK